jgi:hypothetical protein
MTMSDELTRKRQELTRLKTRHNFDETHPGGVEALLKKIEATPPPTLKELSEHYGRTIQRMAVIVQTILGMPYSKYLAGRKINRQRVKSNGDTHEQ